MDRKQLVTIAITAVTSVIAKELISWLVALVRSTAKTQTAKAKTRTIFSKNNFLTFLAMAWSVTLGALLWSRLHETTPVTRVAVFWVVLSMFNFAFALVMLGANIMLRIYDWHISKTMHPSVPVPAVTVSGDTADSQQTPGTLQP
jgi:hypothetical protein